jgi:hypothetical protein
VTQIEIDSLRKDISLKLSAKLLRFSISILPPGDLIELYDDTNMNLTLTALSSKV